jgi:glutamate synthase domain-containing protein 3
MVSSLLVATWTLHVGLETIDTPDESEEVYAYIIEHVEMTGSNLGQEMFDNWANRAGNVVMVMPLSSVPVHDYWTQCNGRTDYDYAEQKLVVIFARQREVSNYIPRYPRKRPRRSKRMRLILHHAFL